MLNFIQRGKRILQNEAMPTPTSERQIRGRFRPGYETRDTADVVFVWTDETKQCNSVHVNAKSKMSKE